MDSRTEWRAASPPLVLFSELTGRGNQMSIVSSTESRTEQRTVYMPPETGMAHRSYLSPDRKQVLVVEMDATGGCPAGWCPSTAALPESPSARRRRSAPTPPGPPTGSGCISPPIPAAGSTHGGSVSRTGRPSRSPSASPRKKGFDFAPDGRSFVTSIGTSQSTVWVQRADDRRAVHGIRFVDAATGETNVFVS